VAAITDAGEVRARWRSWPPTRSRTRRSRSRSASSSAAPTGVVDDRLQTNVPGVYAAGALVETMQAVAGVPVPLLPARTRIPRAESPARTRPAASRGPGRSTSRGRWRWAVQIGGVLITENAGQALGRPYVLGEPKGITCARYHPRSSR
jgi:hypothetical protein